MQTRSIRMVFLLASTALTPTLISKVVRADLLLDTGSATFSATVRDPGGEGFGQGVSVSTTTQLHQMAMFLEAPDGGHIKYMIWNGANTSLLLSDTLAVSQPSAPDWILSDPLSFTLNGGSTYYFGMIQDSSTEIIGPFFVPPIGETGHGLTVLDSGNSNYADFGLPMFTSLAGASLPLRLFGTQEAAATEPPLALFLTGFLICGLVAIGWRKRRRSR